MTIIFNWVKSSELTGKIFVVSSAKTPCSQVWCPRYFLVKVVLGGVKISDDYSNDKGWFNVSASADSSASVQTAQPAHHPDSIQLEN